MPSFGAVVSRMSINEIQIVNTSCHDNYITFGPFLYSSAGENNSFIECTVNHK